MTEEMRKDYANINATYGTQAKEDTAPKQKTGKRIKHAIGFRKCSCCGLLWPIRITEDIFCSCCPRCGAKT